MMKVLILNGAAESGKDTTIEFLKKYFRLDIFAYSSIDYVKEVAKENFGWDGEKDVAGRNLLAGIKQLMIGYNDMPTRKVASTIDEAVLFGVDVLAVAIREPDEIEKLVNHCKSVKLSCTTCRVYNEKSEKTAKASELSLTGDRLYGQYDYDIKIHNNGTLKELELEVIKKFGGIYIKVDEIERDSYKTGIPLGYFNGRCRICGFTEYSKNQMSRGYDCDYCGQQYRNF